VSLSRAVIIVADNTSVWGLSSGGRVINVDAEIIANAVLDILAKPVRGTILPNSVHH